MNFSFNRKYFSDEEILNYVNNKKMFTTIVSVVDPKDGHIVMCPVWTIFYKNKFYFSTDNTSKKCKIIRDSDSKIGLTIIEPDSFPQGREGVIPYFSTSGTPFIRTKDEFDDYEDIIYKLYDKFDGWFPNKQAKKDWIHHVLRESDTRVLIEFKPERTFINEKIEKMIQERRKGKTTDEN